MLDLRTAVTAEAALWYTLFTVEGHLERLCAAILEVEATTDEAKISDKPPACLPHDDSLPEGPASIGRYLAAFLVLWLRTFRDLDLFCDQTQVETTLKKIVEDWGSEGLKDELCIMLPDCFEDMPDS